MKRRLRYLIGAGLLAGMLTITPFAFAEATTSGTASSSSSSTTTTTTTPAQTSQQTTTTEAENQNLTTTARLNLLKTSLKIQLTALEQSKIKLRCTTVQGLVATLTVNFETNVVVRTQAYTALTTSLNNLVPKLQAKDVSVTALQAEIVTLKAKISTYATDLSAYKQALSDLKSVDCTADPVAFQAALTAARTTHDTLLTDAAAIRSYVTGTIFVTLQGIHQQLSASSSTTTTSGGTN